MHTQTSPFSEIPSWTISDTIRQLRIKGTWNSYSLERWKSADCLDIGTSPACHIVINDPDRAVSRYHAKLRFLDSKWIIEDNSKNGLFIDETKQKACDLTPGMEIRMGNHTFIAESELLMELHSYVARLLGYKSSEIDRAILAIRMALRRRAPIAFHGDEDLVPVVRDLYRYVLGTDSPFVLCDRRRKDGSAMESAHAPVNITDPEEALRAANGGALCIRDERLPRGFEKLIEKVNDSRSRLQIIVCGLGKRRIRLQTAEAIIRIPNVLSRSDDLHDIIRGYFRDAQRALQMKSASNYYTIDWVTKYAATCYSDIAKSTLRLTALSFYQNLSKAAEVLDLQRESLRDWLESRGPLPFYVQGARKAARAGAHFEPQWE